ncbi:glutaredoxin family protein [Promicromonospora iranensis]|uniref:Glutaredoxin n=1 Tax=Promicromonospora iranensis TaxID=1105144 RepID=A0ABU2CN17_9MICO|nr:glutaredoxin family protein [Promicromonospora iranensis]MDR7382717.1 glutaredoxin [Promicromonospora iranensis]
MTSPAEARVVLYTRAACHLCEDARAVVVQVCAGAGAGWREVDIDSAPALREKYGEYVPVLEVDGVQQGFWRVDGARLARLLA